MLLGIIFLNTELTKPHFLSDEMIFMHCSLQIKQNINSLGIFRAPVVSQFIEKVYRKTKKKQFLKVLPFLYYSAFSNCNSESRTSSDRIICFFL